MAGYRRNVTPGEIAIAMMARRFAACALELQTPYGICSADLLQTLAFTVAPPRRVGLDPPYRTHPARPAGMLLDGADIPDDAVDVG